jgi:general secretion pathway protein I
MIRNCEREAGFTLLEIIVALAIVTLSFSALLSVISRGVGQTTQAETLATAGSLAQSLLAQLGTEVPIQPGQSGGELAGGFHWRLRVEPLGDATQPQNSSVGAYRVSADVFWGEGVQARSVNLTTLRLGPRQAMP